MRGGRGLCASGTQARSVCRGEDQGGGRGLCFCACGTQACVLVKACVLVAHKLQAHSRSVEEKIKAVGGACVLVA